MLVSIDAFPVFSGDETLDSVNEWQRDVIGNATCLVCGEKVFRRASFIWWRASGDIVICADCAEHTIAGMSRDLAELKGDLSCKGKPSTIVNPLTLKAENARLRGQIMKHLQSIVTLQNELAKAK